MVRVTYDPGAAPVIDGARRVGDRPAVLGSGCPGAAQVGWDCSRHDVAVSVSWSMTGAPRGSVAAGVLSRLLAPHPDVDRERVSLLYRLPDGPVPRSWWSGTRTSVRITSGTRPCSPGHFPVPRLPALEHVGQRRARASMSSRNCSCVSWLTVILVSVMASR